LERKLGKYLEKWRKKTGKRPLIIDGPRDVGKTFEVRKLGEQYDSFIEIDLSKHPEFKDVFSDNLNIQNMILNIMTLVPEARFVTARTLIFFDGVQTCEGIFSSLKLWNRDRRYDVILAGEYLTARFDIKAMVAGGTKAFPMGVAEAVEMSPMDFEEFAWAKGINTDVIAALEDCFKNGREVPRAIHNRMMELVREYALTGGMPERVMAHIEGDAEGEEQIAQKLYQQILDDISINCPWEMRKKAERCYLAIPPQLAKKNHKFQYSLLEAGGAARKYEESVKWLEKANLITRTFNLASLDYPARKQEENFRVYPTDIGMLTAGLGEEFKNMLVHGDGLFEALAADMLYKHDHRGECFYNPKCDRIEMEFMLDAGRGYLPLDVKAGRKKNESLKHLIERGGIGYGFKIGEKNVAVNAGQVIDVPIYMLMFL